MKLYQLDNDAFKKMCFLENANYTYSNKNIITKISNY